MRWLSAKNLIAKYYTPKGRSIDGEGIAPDVEVTLSTTPNQMYELELNEEQDPQLATAENLLRHQVDAGKILFDDGFWKTS